jgi:Intracellular septation protein A
MTDTKQGQRNKMGWIRRRFPFNAEQSINMLSEFGPLITMFVMNAAYGIEVGTIALIVATLLAILTMLIVLRRLPIFPLIASAVTITFGALTLATGDPMWVQIRWCSSTASGAVKTSSSTYSTKPSTTPRKAGISSLGTSHGSSSSRR